MKGDTPGLLVSIGAALALVGPAGAADPIQFEILETDDLRLLYFAPSEYLTPHIARNFQNSIDFQRRVFGWEPYETTVVLLKDFGDYGNAAARSAPNNALMVDIAPISRTFETFSASERMFMLMNHELIHVVTMDQWTEQDRRWRRFFAGKVIPDDAHPESVIYSYLTTPRVTVPRWYLEGSAVFMETWMGGGLGRAQGAYDEMVFRSMVRDNARFYSPLGLVSEGTHVDFQVGVNAYLYGTRFMSYLALTYTPQHLIDWYARDEGSERYYADQFEQVFGRELDDVWLDWIAWETEFQTENLDRVQQFPITEDRALTAQALGSVSRAYMDPDSGDLIGAFRYPGVVAHIGRLSPDDGSIERLVDIKGPQIFRVTSLAYDPGSETAFYTTDNYAFRDIMTLDLTTGETRMLLEDARIGELVFNPADRSLWGVRHLNGLASIVRIEYPYEAWALVHTLPYGQVPTDMDISPDGGLLSTSMAQVNGDQYLQVYDTGALMAGQFEPIREFNFGLAVPEGFVFSPDGRYLFGSSYYTGISNIFRFDVTSPEFGFEAVSNAETGYFRPIPQTDGSLIAFSYSGDGFIPVSFDPVPLDDVSNTVFLGQQVAEQHPEVADWSVVSSLRDVDIEPLITNRDSYSTIGDMGLQSIYPVVEGYKNLPAYGMHATFADPMGFDTVTLTATYNTQSSLPTDERWHVAAEYRRRAWTVGATWNRADFYDLFGPVRRSRKGYSAYVGYQRALIYDRPRQLDLTVDVALYGNMEQLPNAQGLTVVFDQLTTFDLALDYQNMRHSLGFVAEEKGYRWDLHLAGNQPDSGTVIPALYGTYDFGFALPWAHSSIWIRTAGGYADGDASDPFANFFIGGFRNNYVDNREVQRYRNYNAFPGVAIDTLSGRSFVRGMIEWNLPPLRFSNAGTPGAYASFLRTAIFASQMTTDFDDSVLSRDYQNIGIQMDLDFTLLHRLPMTLSFGYAVGFRSGEQIDEEFIISLKVL
jgi:hypothetical protein